MSSDKSIQPKKRFFFRKGASEEMKRPIPPTDRPLRVSAV